MASPLCGAFSSPSSIILSNRPPRIALLSRPQPFSLPAISNSSLPATLLSLSASSKWKLYATASSVEAEAAPEPEPEPEPVEVQIAASEASEAPRGEDVFAVVMIGSRQYIVFPGRFLTTQRLKGANANDKIILSKVLLVGTRTKTYIGEPVVTNAAVHAVVEEQGLNRKVTVYKYKRKKNYRRNIGHRQPNTRIRITGIMGYQDFPFETLESLPASVAATV